MRLRIQKVEGGNNRITIRPDAIHIRIQETCTPSQISLVLKNATKLLDNYIESGNTGTYRNKFRLFKENK